MHAGSLEATSVLHLPIEFYRMWKISSFFVFLANGTLNQAGWLAG